MSFGRTSGYFSASSGVMLGILVRLIRIRVVVESILSFLGGLTGGTVACLCVAAVLLPVTSNLSGVSHAAVLACMTVLALLLGALTGSAIGRRSRSIWGGVRLFSALAGSVCGALLGAAGFFAVTLAYMREYAEWPTGTLDVALAIIALPVLAAFGACIGAAVGFGLGGISGSALAVAVPKRR